MKYTVLLAVEQEIEVEADSFNDAADKAKRQNIQESGPINDHWVTGIIIQDNRHG